MSACATRDRRVVLPRKITHLHPKGSRAPRGGQQNFRGHVIPLVSTLKFPHTPKNSFHNFPKCQKSFHHSLSRRFVLRVSEPFTFTPQVHQGIAVGRLLLTAKTRRETDALKPVFKLRMTCWNHSVHAFESASDQN